MHVKEKYKILLWINLNFLDYLLINEISEHNIIIKIKRRRAFPHHQKKALQFKTGGRDHVNFSAY